MIDSTDLAGVLVQARRAVSLRPERRAVSLLHEHHGKKASLAAALKLLELVWLQRSHERWLLQRIVIHLIFIELLMVESVRILSTL
jgi:hypothetical protein